MDPEKPGNLEAQLAALTARVWRIEKTLQSHGISVDLQAVPVQEPAAFPGHVKEPAPAPVVSQPESVPPAPPRIVVPPPLTPPLFAHLQATAPADTRSLESRIGSQWFNRIGIVAVLIGVAWFLKFAFDNHWIGPAGRVLIGLVAGAGLIAWSERFRSRGYAGFSYSLKALGSGILYLSLWAAFSYFHLIPPGAAFAAMVVVTAFNGLMCWLQDAELLALYAIAGGLSTPLLVSTGENHEIALFGYLLLLDAAVLILVALKPWSRLLFVAFAGTQIFIGGWWAEYFSDSQSGRTAFFIACFFFIFALAHRVIKIDLDQGGKISGWDTLALVLLPILNAALGFIEFEALLPAQSSGWAGAWLAVGFAAFYLSLHRLQKGPGVLAQLHLTAAVVFLTIAIPLKTHGRWLIAGWLAEGAALTWIASRMRTKLLTALAILCLILGIGALFIVNSWQRYTTPLFNHRFATYCFGIAVFAFAGWVARNTARESEPGSATVWPALGVASVLVVNLLILVSVCLEIHDYWSSVSWRGNWRILHDHRMYAQFTYSAFLMLFGAALLSIGFWRRSAFLRWQALVLLAVSVAKVFLVDVSELSQGYRILSFLGLGALLLAISFIYQKDWLNLRGAHAAEHNAAGDSDRRTS